MVCSPMGLQSSSEYNTPFSGIGAILAPFARNFLALIDLIATR